MDGWFHYPSIAWPWRGSVDGWFHYPSIAWSWGARWTVGFTAPQSLGLGITDPAAATLLRTLLFPAPFGVRHIPGQVYRRVVVSVVSACTLTAGPRFGAG